MTTTPTQRPQLPRELRRDAMWTFVLLGLSALLWMLGLPLSLMVLASGPATVSFAISALINSRGVVDAAAIRVWLGVAIAMGGLILLAGLGLLLMRGPTEQFERCLDRAITETARRECQVEFEKARDDLLKKYGAVTTR